MRGVLVLLLSLALHAGHGCLEDLDLSYDCDHSVGSLEDLFSRSGDFPPGSTVCVNLVAQSTEILGYSDTSLTFSAVIRGNNSTVICDNSGGDMGVNYTHFPLRFYNVSQVVIRELRFENCSRPLQFEEVKTVVLSFINLRYEK